MKDTQNKGLQKTDDIFSMTASFNTPGNTAKLLACSRPKDGRTYVGKDGLSAKFKAIIRCHGKSCTTV